MLLQWFLWAYCPLVFRYMYEAFLELYLVGKVIFCSDGTHHGNCICVGSLPTQIKEIHGCIFLPMDILGGKWWNKVKSPNCEHIFEFECFRIVEGGNSWCQVAESIFS
jgi:hypothetical protein